MKTAERARRKPEEFMGYRFLAQSGTSPSQSHRIHLANRDIYGERFACGIWFPSITEVAQHVAESDALSAVTCDRCRAYYAKFMQEYGHLPFRKQGWSEPTSVEFAAARIRDALSEAGIVAGDLTAKLRPQCHAELLGILRDEVLAARATSERAVFTMGEEKHEFCPLTGKALAFYV